MSLNWPPLHLAELSICDKTPHAESSVTIPVWVNQLALDGMQALIHTCEGMSRDGKGFLPGLQETSMFYRTLVGCVKGADEKAKEALKAESSGK